MLSNIEKNQINNSMDISDNSDDENELNDNQNSNVNIHNLNLEPFHPEISSASLQYLKSIKLKFRNYKPMSDSLNQFYEPGEPSFIHDKMNKIVENERQKINVNLLPIKMDEDLKRDIGDDLKVLDQETKNAIREMIQKKLDKENNKNY